jgi:hypothetical protein
MNLEVTPDEMIESLVRVNYGKFDQREQQLFRQSLQVLVELAKQEQRTEDSIDAHPGSRPVMH